MLGLLLKAESGRAETEDTLWPNLREMRDVGRRGGCKGGWCMVSGIGGRLARAPRSAKYIPKCVVVAGRYLVCRFN